MQSIIFGIISQPILFQFFQKTFLVRIVLHHLILVEFHVKSRFVRDFAYRYQEKCFVHPFDYIFLCIPNGTTNILRESIRKYEIASGQSQFYTHEGLVQSLEDFNVQLENKRTLLSM